MSTIVTHTFQCRHCHETTDVHTEDGSDVVAPECEYCGSLDMEKQNG